MLQDPKWQQNGVLGGFALLDTVVVCRRCGLDRDGEPVAAIPGVILNNGAET
jgi:hypothetical protein